MLEGVSVSDDKLSSSHVVVKSQTLHFLYNLHFDYEAVKLGNVGFSSSSNLTRLLHS